MRRLGATGMMSRIFLLDDDYERERLASPLRLSDLAPGSIFSSSTHLSLAASIGGMDPVGTRSWLLAGVAKR